MLCQDSSDLMLKLFKMRKKVFIKSLNETLKQIATDPLIHQFFQDPSTERLILDRFEEIIKKIITDNREIFINSLLQKIQKLDQIADEKKRKELQRLGSKIISISREQTMEQISQVSHIKCLNEQIQALQKKVIELDVQNLGQDPSVIEITDKKIQQNKSLQASKINDYSPLRTPLKMIQTDCLSIHEQFKTMNSKMSQIFSIARSKCIQKARIFDKRINQSENSLLKANTKISELENHFNNFVIPELIRRHHLSSQKYKAIIQDKDEQILKLQNNYKSEIAQKNSEIKRLTFMNQGLEQQHEEDENKISSLELQNYTDSKYIIDRENQLADLSKKINVLQDELKKAQQLNESLKDAKLRSDLLEPMAEKFKNASTIIDNLQALVQEKDDQMLQLNNKINQLNLDKAQKENEISSLKEYQNQHQETINHLEECNKKSFLEIQTLKKTLSDRENTITEKNLNIADLDKKLEIQNIQIKELTNNNNSNQLTLQEMEKEKGNYFTQNNQLKDNLQKIEKSNSKIKAILEKIKDILQMSTEDDDSDTIQLVQKMKQQTNDYNKLMDTINVSSCKKLIDIFNDLEQSDKVLQQIKKNFEISSFENIPDKCNQLKEIENQYYMIKEILSVSKNDEVIERIKQYKEDHNSLSKIQETVNAKNKEDISPLISSINESHHIVKSVLSKLGLSQESQIQPKIEKLANEDKIMQNIMNMLNIYDVHDQETLPEKIKNLQEADKTLSIITENLSSRNSSFHSENIIPYITELTNNNNILQKIKAQLSDGNMEINPQMLENKISQLKSANNDLDIILSTTNTSTTHAAINEISKMRSSLIIIQELQNYLNVKQNDIFSAVGDLQSAKHSLNDVMKKMNVHSVSSLLRNANEYPELESIVKQLTSLFDVSYLKKNSLLQIIRLMKTDYENLKAEQNHIMKMIGSVKNVDISSAIESIVKKQKQQDNQLSSASSFISQIIDGITGSKTSQIIFPINEEIKFQLLDLVHKQKYKADSDRAQIDDIISEAHSLGYKGNSLLEAAKFSVMHRLNKDNSNSMNLDDSNNGINYSELQASLKERDILKKRIKKLNGLIAHQSEEFHKIDEEMTKEKESLLMKNSQLKHDCETERLVREEIIKVASGNSPNEELLRTKLSDDDVNLVLSMSQLSFSQS